MGICSSVGSNSVSPSDSMIFEKELPIFEPHEIQLVRETWKLLCDDMVNRGVKVFHEIFRRRPDAKALFSFRYVPDERLSRDSSFKTHAVRFMQVVSATVEAFDTRDRKLACLLVSLGQTHHRHGVHVSTFKAAFLQSMLVVWEEELGDKFSLAVRMVWIKMFDFIIETLICGCPPP